MSAPLSPPADLNRTTLKALKGSIAKWKRIVAGTGADSGGDNCPLCKIFLYASCAGCPVSDRTGYAGCEGSPYDRWRDLIFWPAPFKAKTKMQIAAAEAELRFLQSLLPKPAAKKATRK